VSDDDLKRRVNALVPPAEDVDVETALTRTRAMARTRSGRRRLTLRAAPLAVAAATVIIVLLATVGPWHGSGRSSVKQPTSPTAVTAWFRHVVGESSGPAGPVDLTSVWVVRLSDPNNGTFDVRPRSRFGAGNLHYDGSRGGFMVDVLGRYCNNQPGVYRVATSGQSLVFTLVTDPCQVRRDVLDNTVFQPLTNPDQLGG